MIFPFFSKTKNKREALKVDLHSHLIPGIDDGAKDIDESLQLLKGLVDVGYKKIITTPHIMLDAYQNNRINIMEGLDKLQEVSCKAGLDVVLEAAAEYYLDDGFVSHLEKGDMLTVGDKYILCETSYIAKPLQFEKMVLNIIDAGYTPILAHPERYRYIHDYAKEYREMKELGILFQVNSNSFGGHYGKEAQKKATFLSKESMIDFLGSDIHHNRQVKMLKKVQDLKAYQNVFNSNKILNNSL